MHIGDPNTGSDEAVLPMLKDVKPGTVFRMGEYGRGWFLRTNLSRYVNLKNGLIYEFVEDGGGEVCVHVFPGAFLGGVSS